MSSVLFDVAVVNPISPLGCSGYSLAAQTPCSMSPPYRSREGLGSVDLGICLHYECRSVYPVAIPRVTLWHRTLQSKS